MPGTETDFSALKEVLGKSTASLAFICLEDSGAALPPEVTESFGGVVHVFWKKEIRSPLSIRDFRLLSESAPGKESEPC